MLSRATNDLYPIRYFIGWGVVQVVSSVMMIVGVTIVLLSVNARLMLYAGLTMPLIALLTWRFARLVTPLSRVVQQRKADLTEAADESIVGMEMVQAFGREAEVKERFRERAEGVRTASLREARVEAKYLPGLTFLPSMAIASVLFFGGRDVIDGNLTIGQFVLFNSLLLQLVWPLEALGWILNLAQRAIASASRAFAWLDAVQPLPEAAEPAQLPAGGLDVRFEDVCFAYAGGSPVLATSTSRSRRAPSSRSAARRARASRRCSTCSRASTTPTAAACASAASRCRRCARPICAPPSRS